ncbi:MAG: hypothetical protein KGN84_04210, partial [Acidobacteriota bacterium]|nr:hypothetical protein [Acidobacteriota bacterium]
MKSALLLFALAGALSASSPAAWEMTTFADFIKGKFDGVSLGRDGRLSLAPKLDTFFASEQPVIWSVAAAPDGSLYAATGHRGRVFRIDALGAAKLIWTAPKPEVFAIAADRRGVVYAASSPDGKIYRIENGAAAVYFDPKEKYIWSLALAPDGALFAGTSGGKVFRIAAANQGEEYYATGQGNVTGLMIDAQGHILAGTEPNGILYRIAAKGKAFALYDSSLPEIRAIAANPDGSVYAAGLGGALASKIQAAQQNAATSTDASGTAVTSITVTADSGGDLKPDIPKAQQAAPAQAAQTAAPTATQSVDLSNVEKSAIYRINPDNTVDTLWSSKEENVFDLLPAQNGQVYFVTDEYGRVYRLTEDHRLTLVAQTNESETTRLLRVNGALFAATGNMGRIYRLGAAGVKGTYQSPVFDAGSVARWGKLRWQGENGAGSVSFRTRTGNSIRPDSTWSDWSAPLKDAAGTQIASPNARYLQFEAALSGTGAVVDTVSAAYLPQNNPPLVRSITVLTQPSAAVIAAGAGKTSSPVSSTSAASAPFSVTVTDTGDSAPATSTGTPTQTLSRATAQQMTVSWQADDPDSDRLVYDLYFRGDDEQDWKVLKRGLHDNTYTIDGDALADGRYFFKVNASDREANPSDSAKEADLVSTPVLIDNTPPVIHVRSSSRTEVVFDAQDSASILKRAEWSIDAGPWTPVAPV